MKPTYKQTILGRKITKAQALEGLGDPDKWEEEVKSLEAQFHVRRVITARSQDTSFNLSKGVVVALRTAGIRPVQTRNLTDNQLRKVAGIGPSRIKEIRKRVGRQRKTSTKQ